MASSSPLLEESEQTSRKVSTVNRWTSLFYSTVLGKDEIMLAVEKVGKSQPFRAKEKYLTFLMQSVQDNILLFDDILLKFSAVTDWANSTVGSCKIMMAIHEIIRYNRTYLQKFDNAIIFLSEMASHWKIHENYFLERYAAAIMNLAQLLTEYSVLSNIVFENGFYYSAKMRLQHFSSEELIAYITRLLQYQDMLILATARQTGKLKENERLVNLEAQWIILEESKKVLPLIDYLINFTEEKLNDGFLGGTSLNSLREQREAQERTIHDMEQRLNS